MQNLYYFLAILVPVLGIFVTVIIAVIKFSRNSVTKDDLRTVKDDLSNKIDVLRLEMNRRFEEAVDARAKIREEMSEGFAKAEAAREKIRDEAAADRKQIRIEVMEARKAIEGEMSRHNQNYIEHLVYHNTRKPKPDAEEEDST